MNIDIEDVSGRRGSFVKRIGMMASMFISNPIQISNQCELSMTIMVPVMIVAMMIMRIGGFISTGRV